ncbi:MAG: sporulation initiation factor Spo0A C-terminal domain-containing protein [Bacilli bacterium]|nr:sporulation initiation factor Spo0A C-terminal domain-containing protein [Bacilli bacterium]
MIKLLIIEQKNMIKKLSLYFEKNKDFFLSFIIDDGLIGLNYIINNMNKYDVVIMDMVIKNKDGISILKEMDNRNIYKPVIISTSFYSESVINEASNYNVCAYLLKPYDIKDLENKIKETLKKEKCYKVLNENIIKILHGLGIPSCYKGYKYLKEAINICCKKTEYLITKDIYSELANKHNVSVSSIERAISRVIEVGFNRNDCDFVEEVFGNTINFDRGSPTNLEFIETVVERLNIIK